MRVHPIINGSMFTQKEYEGTIKAYAGEHIGPFGQQYSVWITDEPVGVNLDGVIYATDLVAIWK